VTFAGRQCSDERESRQLRRGTREGAHAGPNRATSSPAPSITVLALMGMVMEGNVAYRAGSLGFCSLPAFGEFARP
jgi:hypothetical protein